MAFQFQTPFNLELIPYLEFSQKLPDSDTEEVFGFNDNITRLHSKNLIFDIFRHVNRLNTKSVPFNNPLDIKTKDENDLKVKEIALGLLRTLPQQFAMEMVNTRYPMSYEEPLTIFIHREISKYNSLIQEIRFSLIDLVNTIDGKLQSSYKMEQLWYQILFNYVPHLWLLASYPTCYKSLGDYIVNLNERLSFIKELIEKGSQDIGIVGEQIGLPSYWFPGFFDQNSFLTVLRQKRSRTEKVELDQIENIFEITDLIQTDIPPKDKFSIYIHGLWLEGAQWKNNELQETSSDELYFTIPCYQNQDITKGIIKKSRIITRKRIPLLQLSYIQKLH